MLYISHVTV